MNFIFTVFFLGMSVFAQVPPAELTVIGLVGKDGAKEDWAKEACLKLQRSVALSFSQKVNLHCVWLRDNEMINPDVQKIKQRGDIRYQVELRETNSGEHILRVVDLAAPTSQEATQPLANAVKYFIEHPSAGSHSRAQELVADSDFSEAISKTTVSGGGPSDFFLFAKTALAAYHEKSSDLDEEAQLKGYNLYIGPASAIEFGNHSQKNGDKGDFIGIINVHGGTMQLSYYGGGFRVIATVDVYGDVAMVRPTYIVDKYIGETGKQGWSTVLQNQDYYYAAGMTSRGQVIVEYGRWNSGASITQRDLNFINKGTSYQTAITDSSRITDSRLLTEVFVSYQLTKNFSVKFAFEHHVNRSEIKDYGSGIEGENRHMGFLVYHF